ncbi:methyl-accepting chemotaxis protein [Aeromonas schubertii]|uniref:methyl-accepting chemotaxis protein n=1 Tax=Aeromonas schubertii TaxID=652 RepID=UPI0010A79E0C|nr:methyl-accepting chemotaxis protein [Aeromonas schubertii]QCG49004.1 methyl-accepting chemotaxis protein [Aeromonas schubertii]
MSLRHWTIGQKLTAALSSLGLLLFLIGGLSLWQFQIMNQKALELSDAILPSLDRATEMRAVTTELRRYEIGYLLALDNPVRRQNYQKIIDNQPLQMQTLLDQYGAHLYDDEERRIFRELQERWQAYLDFHHRVWRLIDQEERERVTDILLEEGYPLFSALHASVAQLVERNHGYAREGKALIEASYRQAVTSIVVALFIGMALVILLATLLTRQIRNPLLMLTAQAGQVADGRLGHSELDDWLADGRLGYDELGQLARAIARMKRGLGDLVSEISSSVTQLGSAVEEVGAISEQSSQGMRQQQQDITQVATAMEQMHSTVQEVARNTTEAAGVAHHALDSSRQGGEVVADAIVRITRVAGEIEQAGEVVSRLEAESSNISQVLDVIRGIADQTNLLALNAAIEAARAGEQGRGFAVVADEVRTLASRTQASTAEINQMIERLQERAAAATCAMTESRARMLETVTLAQEADQQLSQIRGSVGNIHHMNTQIASATEEQHLVTADLSRNIESIHAVASENAQGAQHTAQASHELAQLAQHLQQRISRFTLT